MKCSVIILLLSYSAIATCTAASVVNSTPDCRWTGCEGLLRSGDSVCQEYGFGTYSGHTLDSGCSFDTEKVRCCKETPQKPGCKWTKCYEAFGKFGGAICNIEFGLGYEPSDKIEVCLRFMTKFECCPSKN